MNHECRVVHAPVFQYTAMTGLERQGCNRFVVYEGPLDENMPFYITFLSSASSSPGRTAVGRTPVQEFVAEACSVQTLVEQKWS